MTEFGIDLPSVKISRLGHGHIHETFRIGAGSPGSAGYLLQKINQNVFHDVPELMANLTRVTQYLRQSMSQPDTKNSLLLFPLYRTTRSGIPFYRDDEGNCWRICQFIPHVPMKSLKTAAVEGAGRVFGLFLFYLRELPVEDVRETLPNFHTLTSRLENFQVAVQGNPRRRLSTCQSEVDQIRERREAMQTVYQLADKGEIPWRVTHNDTKMDNVLFGQNGAAIAVVDLDTVMPGLVHYDFGDAIRTCANRGAEDAQDLDTVEFDLTRFEAFSRGYLGETAEFLNEAEKSTLIEAPQLLTYLMAIRFLTDYLLGDIYYHTDFPLHNLVRARVQLRLLKQMALKRPRMERILRSLCQLKCGR